MRRRQQPRQPDDAILLGLAVDAPYLWDEQREQVGYDGKNG
ncbi:MAG: hypothetical protein WAT12_11080 [Candidatus Nitrotoga sp.]